MSKLLLVFVVLSGTISLSSQEWTKDDIDIYYSFDAFKEVLSKDNDTSYVVNFWATWCVPCVKELPYFEEINRDYSDKKLKVVLVSLDFEKKIDTKLIPFLNKNKIRSKVALLLDSKESYWIDKVDPSWSGSIPITLVYNGKKRDFYEKAFHSTAELKEILNEYINP
jgi:thiol-disulfide isomerase/thioredoxin